ncbi:hypothetical protein BDP27DRAFT_1372942 [Rhodocollybia butyracea]|uniref:Uncharacterized protein n=1 Tax=Rhodocollybia butyracea TaxID=206335 RepID=A0A9P5P9I3_9AGAR|nr:hypothetical protein BDP27DRAFT_1372942 [Rhodocollybia butyracea]
MNPPVSQSSIHAPIEEYQGLSPRVNGSLLPLFIGLYVTLPCRIAAKDAGLMTVIASDGSEVKVHMLAANREPSTKFVEVMGKVCNDDGVPEIVAIRVTDMTNDLDLLVVDRVIKHIHSPRFKNTIFNVDGQRIPWYKKF